MAGPSFFPTPKVTVTDIAELLGSLRADIKTLENICEPDDTTPANKLALEALTACDRTITANLDPTSAGPKP